MKKVKIKLGGPLCKRLKRQAKSLQSLQLVEEAPDACLAIVEEIPVAISLNTILLSTPSQIQGKQERLVGIRREGNVTIQVMSVEAATAHLKQMAA
jgi:hypothetical protein